VSWYEDVPAMSLEMIVLAGAAADAPVIDVGGGASPLAGALLERGYTDLTVLDISGVAQETARSALSEAGERVAWIRADVLDWSPARAYRLWHDRAVFHFMVDPADRERYVATARAALSPGGCLVVGTFAEDGPATCSGLPVRRYGPAALAEAFGEPFTTIAVRRDEHRTPGNAVQPFTWVALRSAANETWGRPRDVGAGSARDPRRLFDPHGGTGPRRRGCGGCHVKYVEPRTPEERAVVIPIKRPPVRARRR
jgi:hypothetical protein